MFIPRKPAANLDLLNYSRL